MIREFRNFIMQGNVLDLAVAVIIGGAFGAIITSLTNDIILPPIGLLLGDVNFSDLAITLKAAEVGADGAVTTPAVQIRYGNFLQTIINFLIIAASIFMILKAYAATQKKQEEAAPAPPPEPSNEEKLLAEIRDLLKK